MKAPAEKAAAAQRSPREAVRTALRVPGTPLEPATRRRFEAAFNCDLGHVRIHTDAAAAQAAHELDAVAFSLGRDIFFAAGAYEPHTARGHAVVAHELVHTLQDPRRAEPDALDELTVAPAASSVEGDAHAAAAALRHGRVPVASSAAPRRATPQIARLAAGLVFSNPNDPAQIVGALAATIKVALKNDPDDRLGRVRRSLDFLEEDTRKLALTRLERELLSPDWKHLSELLSQPTPSGTQSGDAQDATPADGAEPREQDADAEAAEGVTDGLPATAMRPGDQPKATAEPESAEGGKPGDRAAAKGVEPKDPHHERGAPKMTLHGARPRRKHGPGAGPRAPRPRRGKAAGGYALPAMGGAAEPPAPVEQPEAPLAGETADAEPAAAESSAAPEAGPETAGAAPDAATETQPESSAAPAPEAAAAPDSEPAMPAEAAAPAEAPPATGDAAPLAAEPADANAPAEASAPAEQTAAATETAPAESAPEPDAAQSAGEAPEPATGVADAGTPSGTPPVGDLPPETDDGSEAPSGGGGGGSTLAEQPEEPAAQVPADAEPSAALAAVAAEPPDKLEPALGAVTGSVGRTVGADRTDLAAHPPELTPQAAAQAAGGAPPPAAPAAAATAAAVARAPSAPVPESVTIAPIPPPAPLPEIAAPSVTANADGQVTAEDAQHVRQAVDQLPESDPALDVKIAPPPDVPLTGAADPSQADTQRAAVVKSSDAASADGRRDAAQPMGEDHIYPTKPPVTLRGEPLPAAPVAAAAPGPAAATPADPAVAIVARERSADQVQAAARNGVQDLAAKRDEQQSRATQERADSQRTVDEAIRDDATAQRSERNTARKEVLAQRADWGKEQAATVDDAGRDGDDAVRIAKTDTEKFRNDARGDARREVDARNTEIAQTRKDAQDKARAERARAKKESDEGGFFSRIGSAIGSFFDKIKGAIKGFFNWARDKIKQAIDAVTTFVTKLIDKARDLIVAAIKLAGDALIAIGDRVLAAFPKLRDRFRAAIHKAVDAAVAVVNALADGLKKAVTALLSLLGKALTALLDAYEALYLAAVDVVAGVVKAAINAAKAVVAALAVFAVLIRDIASDPGGWLRNLGSALMDGVRNHLWRELKLAVKEWFNSKVEAVVGIGKLIFDVLKKGGIPFRRVGAMVWSAVKAMIPRAIIEFLIQKVISMLIPAAAAVMAIIEGLQAAWATASRIIAAFESFFAFLKAVRGGHAGPQFAKAVAAAAVAVIDFTANFIISKIGKGAKGVGTRLKGIAAKIMAWLRRGVAAVKRVAGRVGRAIVRGVRAVGRGLRAAGRWIAKSRIGRYIATSRVGRAAVRAYERGRAALQRARDRFKAWNERRKAKAAATSEERMARARSELVPKIQARVHGHGSALLLRASMLVWRFQYHLRSLRLRRDGGSWAVAAAASPEQELIRGVFVLEGESLRRMLHLAAEKLLADPKVIQACADIASARGAGGGRAGAAPLVIAPGAGVPGASKYFRDEVIPPGTKSRSFFGVRSKKYPIGTAPLDYLLDVGGVPVGQTRVGLSGKPSNILVTEGGRYKNIVTQLEAAYGKDPGKAAAELVKAQQAFYATGSFAGAPPQARSLIANVTQIQVLEGARHESDLLNQAMRADLATSGKLSAQQMMVGLNPMEMQQASKRAAGMKTDLGIPLHHPYATAASRAQIKEFVTVQMALIETWLLAKLQTEKRMSDSEPGLLEWVRNDMYDALLARARAHFSMGGP